MKQTSFMTANQCRGAEKRMQFAADAGGIKEGEKMLLPPDRCLYASNVFLRQWTWFKGGKFNEIIKPDEFTKVEIQAILSKLQ